MGILNLPIEIIQLIGNVRFSKHFIFTLINRNQNGKDSLKALRLVCSQLNLTFEAQVLSSLVIAVTNDTLKQSVDMLSAFASQSEKTNKAVQHARTLKIEYLSPLMTLESEIDGPESQDPPSTRPPALMRRLASAISSLKRRFK